MFRNFKNTKLGKYYSAVLNKYGTITPFAIALALFAVILTIDSFDLFGLVKEASNAAYIVTLVILGVMAAAAIYYMVTKLISKRIGGVDLLVFIDNVLAVLVLIQILFMDGTTIRTILYVVALVLVVCFTIARVAMAKPDEKVIITTAEPNATLKTYCKALIGRFNIVAVVAGGLALFAALYLFDGVELEVTAAYTNLMIVALALLLATVLFNVPRRIASNRMGQVDAALMLATLGIFLYVIAIIVNFTVFKLVAWLVGLAVALFFDVLLIKHTAIEEPARSRVLTGKRGAGVYFKQLAASYNLIFAVVLGVLGAMIMYCLIAIDVMFGTATYTLAGFYIAIDALVLAGFLATFLAAKNRRISGVDYFIFVLTVFALFALIPTIQYFNLLRLICWILLVCVLIATFVLRILNVVEVKVEDAEIYNPARIFSKENCKSVVNGVAEVFSGNKDAHYISNKESRRIARENMRITKEYEREKKRKNVPESEYVTKMKDDRNIVEFDNLHTYFFSDAGVVKAVNGVTFDIPQGSTVGVVGESGCGKSVTALSLMQLVQAPKGQVIRGSEIRFKSTAYVEDEHGEHIPIYEVQKDENGNELKDENGNPLYVMAPKMVKGKPVVDKDGKPVMERVQMRDANGIPLFETEEKVYNVAKMPTEVMRKIRGREITMIFQEPMTSLNPIFTIGKQLDEVVLLHVPGATKESARARTFEMLKMVGIIPENVYKRYPHELSGGMRQRVMIAMALLCHPKLIIADEPTTALDVTIQAQILDLLRDVKKQINGSIMLITHDLGVIAEMADFVVVMYAGRIIEMGTTKEIFDNPLHPYTMGLQKSKPAVNKKVDRLYSIPGSVPNPIDMPNYCYFRDRCNMRCDKCNGAYPEMIQVSPTHKVSCHLYEKEDETNGK